MNSVHVLETTGLIVLNWPHALEQRRLVLRTFKDLGVGKDTANTIILQECSKICDQLRKEAAMASRNPLDPNPVEPKDPKDPINRRDPIDPSNALQSAIMNVVGAFVFGRSMGDSPKFLHFQHILLDKLLPFVGDSPVITEFARCIFVYCFDWFLISRVI